MGLVEPPKGGAEGLGPTGGEPEITDLRHATGSAKQRSVLPWGLVTGLGKRGNRAIPLALSPAGSRKVGC